jgi:outer membrane lipoprotein carrier protein
MDPGKFWLRLRRRTTERVAALLLCLTCVGAGAQPQPTGHEPAKEGGAAALERFLADVQSLTADFEEQTWSSDEQLLEASSGTLALKRPNRFRLHYVEPMEQLVVTDGRRLWMHDVDLSQATVTPLDDAAASSPAMLLSGDQAVRDEFDVVEEFVGDGLEWVRLAPRQRGSEFSAVLIGFRDGALERLELIDGFDQTLRIALVDVTVNPELDEDLFQFEAPEGVDVLGSGD